MSVVLQRNQLIEQRSLNCTGTGSSTYEMQVYDGLVTLPPASWQMRIVAENRTGSIYNLARSAEQALHLEATLNNSSPASRQNFSPRFTTYTLPVLCQQQRHNYSFSAFDANGDSLAYHSVQPQSSQLGSPLVCGTPIPYPAPSDFSFTDPVTNTLITSPAVQLSVAFPLLSFEVVNGTARPLFDLNPATGELSTQPRQAGLAAVAVRVDEYRRLDASQPRAWTHIGSVTRDVVYTVFTNTGNHNPGLVAVTVAGSSTQLLNKPVAARPGQTVAVTLTGADADAGQTLQLSTDAGALVPGLSLKAAGTGQAVLTWEVPATLPPGRYPLAVTVADNACPLKGSEVYTLVFEVGAQSSLATAGAQEQVTATAFPQPFQEQVRFRASAGPVTITDGVGRVVSRLLAPASGWCTWHPAATVPAGIYFAKTTGVKSAVRLVYAGN
jgi:hypothetical protein